MATYSLLPLLQAVTKGLGVTFELWDISLAGRIIANFPDRLQEEQRIPNWLSRLGELIRMPSANIIKLPNISASVPQLKEAIGELQAKGYDLPDYPEHPATEAEKELCARFAGILGSAVNPILREGNSDRRAAASVKRFGRKKPHKMMKEWSCDSKTCVAHMTENDFFENEQSTTVENACRATIRFIGDDGRVLDLKKSFKLQPGEIIDATVMNVKALRRFFEEQMRIAKESDVLLSLHLKSTMMKVSDPIIFGHCVSVYFRKVFEKHAATLEKLKVNANNGLGDFYAKIETLPQSQKEEIKADMEEISRKRPKLSMVNSDKGITNLHAPNDIIIDASIPVVVRDGGRMWGPDGRLRDTIAMIPDRCYATMYREIFEHCRQHGAFDPITMGSVPNVGLMAQKAEEYGSHNKTFEAPANGTIRVAEKTGNVLLERKVEAGDIFRMCRTKDAPICNWVGLAVNRTRRTLLPAVFWLDEKRAHDRQLIAKVEHYLPDHDTDGLDIRILPPVEAMRFTLERIRKGEDTISVTGNVLRDYLTDLFPILELGTSAKIISIVSLMNGGGLFETGAGGSAPKHVMQFVEEGHLRWDSLGEYYALVASLEHLSTVFHNDRAWLYAETLSHAIEKHLEKGKSPSRKVRKLDTRGSHFYLALYWAQALARQRKDAGLQSRFSAVAQLLSAKKDKIMEELNAAQGLPAQIGGYYFPDELLTKRAMRPSPTLNAIVSAM